MAISMLSLKGDKESAWSGAARIGADAVNGEGWRSTAQFAANFMGNAVQLCRESI